VLRLVAFDMDGTLVDVESSFAVVHEHFGERNEEGLRRFLANEIDDEEFLESDVRIWRRHKPDITIGDLEAILATAPLMPGAGEVAAELRRRGVRTAIVSGGIDLLARRIAREIGMDIALANGFRVDPKGHLTGQGIIRVPIHAKEGVLARLQAELGISPAETASVGNSDIDVGLFRRSRLGIAFRPEDAAVRAGAHRIVPDGDLTGVLRALDEFPAE
jgi:phosphoserine phosphatase